MADELAVAASAMQPCENLIKGESKLEIIFIPAVPDNIEHWQVFHDDSQIINFLNNINEFAECDIDWKTEEDKDVEIVDLASNVIPRGVIPLERLFDRDDDFFLCRLQFKIKTFYRSRPRNLLCRLILKNFLHVGPIRIL